MLETLIESQIYCQFTMVGLIYKTPVLIALSGHANPCLNLLVISLLNRKVLFRLREQFINVGCELKDGGELGQTLIRVKREICCHLDDYL